MSPSDSAVTSLESAAARAADTALERVAAARAAIGSVIFGQDSVVEGVLITVLSGGHGLLVGVPGLAKTKLVETLGTVLGLNERRVQFTPDLMPADILGSEILEEGADHRRYDLPKPFHVLATQNPIEQEGTYPLPEAQLDRFLMQIDVLYPDRASERRILLETTGETETKARQAMSADDLMSAQRLVRRLPIGESVVESILDLVRSARPGEGDAAISKHIAWGPGPRAAQALMLATRARALIGGRLSPSIDDVKALALPVLKHRMALSFAARADGETVPGLVTRLVEKLG